MTRRVIAGRTALDRAGVAERTGAAYTTVTHWHRKRRRTGFPHGFSDEHGREWFWQDEVDVFHTAHLEAKRAELTTIDRSGDPDELVGSGTATKILNYASHRNLPDALWDHPDQVETLPSGRIRRRWYRRTVWAVADARTGRQSTGRTPGSATGPRKPHPYADDPRLSAALDLIHGATTKGEPPRGLGVE
ncbi:MAG TPA: hypothetical protein VGM93_11915, partial [Acidimicrobiales bacterium]